MSLKRKLSSNTTATASRSVDRLRSRTSTPSRVTEPLPVSYKRARRERTVVLPDPVAPTMATTSPPSMSRLKWLSAGRPFGGVGAGSRVREGDVGEPDRARAGRQPAGVSRFGHCALALHDGVQAVARHHRTLDHHDISPDRLQRPGEHGQVSVKGDEHPHAQLVMDDQVAADPVDRGQFQHGDGVQRGEVASPGRYHPHGLDPDFVGGGGQTAFHDRFGAEALHSPVCRRWSLRPRRPRRPACVAGQRWLPGPGGKSAAT